MIIQDPRNMHLDDIRKVLQNCYRLQVGSGPESSFRFVAFIGPKRQRMLANYPEIANPGAKKHSEPVVGRKKKGKQREDVLQGLLRIDESVEPPTEGHANPSANAQLEKGSPNERRTHAGAVSQENDWVRIDMRQMLQLKEMGHDAIGPVNGPNEGYPEYEVSTMVFKKLTSLTEMQHTPNGNEQAARVRPDVTESEHDLIDPSLLGEETRRIGHEIHHASNKSADGSQMQLPLDSVINPASRSESPTQTPNNNLSSVAINPVPPKKSAKKKVTKRAQPNLSPGAMIQTRNTKKKKVTGDDLAALEAQNMVQSGSKRRSKPTRRM